MFNKSDCAKAIINGILFKTDDEIEFEEYWEAITSFEEIEDENEILVDNDTKELYMKKLNEALKQL